MASFLFVSVLLTHLILLTFACNNTYFTSPKGTRILYRDIYRHLPNISVDSIPHIIFQHDPHDVLRSIHRHISINHIAPNIRNVCKQSHCTTVRSGNGYAFAMNSKTGSLVSAWGPALQLRQLSLTRYPGIFLNLAEKTKLDDGPFDRASYRRFHSEEGIRQWPSHNETNIRMLSHCEKHVTLVITGLVDSSFSSLYENDKPKLWDVINGLETHLNGLFNQVCVNLTMGVHNPSIGEEMIPTKDELTVCKQSVRCSRASLILRKVSKKSEDVSKHSTGIYVLFIGSKQQSSTLAGATYRRAMCDKGSSVAFVFGEDSSTLAHEIAHTIGASHDDSGIMKPIIERNERLEFSAKSKYEIERFLWRDASSFCLHLLKMDRKIEYHDVQWSQAAFAGHALVVFLSKQHHYNNYTAVYNESSIYSGYWFNPEVPCRESYVNQNILFNRTNSFEDGTWKDIPFFNFSAGTRLHDIAFGVPSPESPFVPMFVSYFRNFQPRYRVGFGFRSDDGSPPKSWSDEISMPSISPLVHVQSSSIALGSIQSKNSVDMVHVIFTKPVRYVKASYRVGFNVSSTGHVRGGWSDFIPINGYFGYKVGRSSVSIGDIDGNGRPELLVNHFITYDDLFDHFMEGFVRIARDLDTRGHPKGGWTDFFSDEEYYYQCGDVILDAKCSSSFVSTGNIHALSSNMYYRRNVIKQQFLQTAKIRGPSSDIFDGCVECFSTYSQTDQCKQRAGFCASKVEEVHLSPSSLLTSRSETEPREWQNQKKSSMLRTDAADAVNISPFCVGFEYFLNVNADTCDAIDRERVIAKGVEILFLKEFNSSSSSSDSNFVVIYSKSIFEDPVATNGLNNNQVVAQFELIVRASSRSKAVGKAIRKMSRLSRRRGMSDVFSKIRFKSRRGKTFTFAVVYRFHKLFGVE